MAQGSALITVLVINCVVFAAAAAFFLFYWRRRSPSLYYPRKRNDPVFGTAFAWLLVIAATTVDEVARGAGFIAAMYLRFVYLAVVYGLLACALALVLVLPVDVYAGWKLLSTTQTVQWFELTTGMTLTDGSSALWIPTLVFAVLHASLMALLLVYQHLFHKQRELLDRELSNAARSSSSPSSSPSKGEEETPARSARAVIEHTTCKCTVKVRYLPHSLVTPAPLLKLLRDRYGDDRVVAVHVVLHRPALEKLKHKKKKLLRKLDQAHHPEYDHGWLPWCNVGRKRLSVAKYEEKVRQVSADIRLEQASSAAGTSTGIAFVTFADQHAAYAFLHRKVLQDVVRANDDPAHAQADHGGSRPRLSTNIERLVQRGMGALSAATKRSTSIGSAEQRMALLSSYSGADVRMGDEQIDPAVLQDLISSEDSWRLKQASRPDDILWHNLRNSHKVQAKWGFVTMILVVIIAFFWAIPIALLSSLSVVTIGNFFGSFAKDLAQNYLPALLLVVGDLSVPFLFEPIAKWERPHTTTSLEMSVMLKYLVFIIFNHLVFPSLIMGGFRAVLTTGNLVSNPTNSIDVSISGAFMVNFLVQSALIGQVGSMLKVGTFIVRSYQRWRAKTPYALAKADIESYGDR